MIDKKLGVSKSTLSNWLNTIPFKPNREVLKRVGEAKLKSALYKQRIKFENIVKMKNEARVKVGVVSSRDILMLGIGLYLGEGSKSIEEVRITNADPAILKLAMRWLSELGGIKLRHFRIGIHCYPDNNVKELIRFWSKELRIPSEQFIKTQIDRRENKSALKSKKLPYGTAHLYVRGGGTLPMGVRNLHRKIMGLIETTIKQI